jgi:D-glycero-D-manno-heptose 1,7-bisphosphate phosphatase
MRAIFLDRDGVICRNRPGHVKSWDEFVFLSRAREGLARLATLDMPIVVVTNQAAINRGMISSATLEEINQRMVAEIQASGGRIDRVYYCPHRPDEGCRCRKPQAGMLYQAAADLGIELQGSYIVGDAWSDVQAGLAVGCRPFLVLTGRGLRQAPLALHEAAGRFRLALDLAEAVTAILQAEGLRPELAEGLRPELAERLRPELVEGMAWNRPGTKAMELTATPRLSSAPSSPLA